MLTDKDRSILLGEEFVVTCDLSAVSAEYPHIQIFNPADSGKKIAIHTLGLTYNSQGDIMVRVNKYNTALGSAGNTPQKVLSSGAASVATPKNGSNASILGNTELDTGKYHSTTREMDKKYGSPIILLENEGLLLVVESVNSAVRGFFKWRETNV